ncbi:hypothetical protein ACJX0J_018897 [Zea mays]
MAVTNMSAFLGYMDEQLIYLSALCYPFDIWIEIVSDVLDIDIYPLYTNHLKQKVSLHPDWFKIKMPNENHLYILVEYVYFICNKINFASGIVISQEILLSIKDTRLTNLGVVWKQSIFLGFQIKFTSFTQLPLKNHIYSTTLIDYATSRLHLHWSLYHQYT